MMMHNVNNKLSLAAQLCDFLTVRCSTGNSLTTRSAL